MRASTLSLSLSLVAVALLLQATTTLASPIGVRVQQRSSPSSGQALVYALQNVGLNKLGEALQANMEVADAIVADPGAKLFLAPVDQAMSALPQWVTSNPVILQATLLQHVLSGSIPMPLPSAHKDGVHHSVAYSLLTDTRFANQPGGNGLPVVLSQQSKRGADRMVIVEALDECPFADYSASAAKTSSFYDVQIAPIARAMTVPGNTTFTLDFIRSHSLFLQAAQRYAPELVSKFDQMPGVTVFAPTDEAWRAFAASAGDATDDSDKLKAILGQHVVEHRAIFSTLLDSQGSMTTSSGQPLLFDRAQNTVRVGSNTAARIVQSDIITRNGVIHSINSVLSNTHVDAARAHQASRSARASSNGPIAGLVTGENAGSSQGTAVPIPARGVDGGNAFKNATQAGNGGISRSAGLPGAAAASSNDASSSNGSSSSASSAGTSSSNGDDADSSTTYDGMDTGTGGGTTFNFGPNSKNAARASLASMPPPLLFYAASVFLAAAIGLVCTV
ncbi:Fasciclin-domain-containing protein [Tilletiaria anomala UBC 951]|uniref:Fasciclin-domain-containing protein n=1 Tax=Tilletiaria anomala (strain ATCC 24038 / CBS 436.72 / UBC 951) TaxID=1037660 RepID=A0A066VLL0_TILAU|nr:Fasciclin-domain-containing protein [Tilletiaria anomala UBC 951]KDN39455.1 Fasciclin-domain-containing protein [Tilletiaria anomala UBC 951]